MLQLVTALSTSPKTIVRGLMVGKNCIIVSLFMLKLHHNIMDRQMDRHNHILLLHLSRAELTCSKKWLYLNSAQPSSLYW